MFSIVMTWSTKKANRNLKIIKISSYNMRWSATKEILEEYENYFDTLFASFFSPSRSMLNDRMNTIEHNKHPIDIKTIITFNRGNSKFSPVTRK